MDSKFTDLPLNPLRTFAVASRHKSFTDAAREMGVSQVAVSRQITVLEGYLGVHLFERGGALGQAHGTGAQLRTRDRADLRQS